MIKSCTIATLLLNTDIILAPDIPVNMLYNQF